MRHVAYGLALIAILIGSWFLWGEFIRAHAGEPPDPWREIRALNRAIQTLQEENRRMAEDIDILKGLPAVKEQFDKEKARREQERR